MQAPVLVDFRRRSFIVIKILQNCTTCTGIQTAQNFVKYMQRPAVVISSALESNHIADMKRNLMLNVKLSVGNGFLQT